mgnify:CR=1 FL=1
MDLDLIRRLVLYSLVGGSGIIVNEAVFAFLQHWADYYLASIVAIETSILWNFFLNDMITFRDRRHGKLGARAFKFHVTAALGAVVQFVVTAFLISQVKRVNLAVAVIDPPNLPYLEASMLNLAGILASFIIRFGLSYLWVWKQVPPL